MAIRLASPLQVRLRNGLMALTGVSAAEPPAPGGVITLTDMMSQAVVQRTGTGTTGSVKFAGTYTGTIAQVEGRVVLAGEGVTAWTPLTTGGGTFSGAVETPLGDDYQIQVRDAAVPATVIAGTNLFGVGVVVLMFGQSNMVNLPETPYQYPLGAKGTREFRTGVFKRIGNVNDAVAPNTRGAGYVAGGYTASTYEGRRGDAFVYIANIMKAALGCPVCLIECGSGGKSVDYWIAGAAGWTTVTNTIAAAGGDFEMAMFYQQESDSNMAYATKLERFATLHQQLRTLSGRNDSALKLGLVALGPVSFSSSYSGASDAKFGISRSAQVQYANNTAGAFLLASAHDSYTSDGVHITKQSYANLGPRIGMSAAAQYGLTVSGAGPRITGATRSGTTVTLSIQHAGGTALLDGAGGTGSALTGFQFADAGASGALIGYTSAIVGNTLVFTLASAPVGALTVSYAMMNAPHSSDPTTATTVSVLASCVYDNVALVNTTLGCPLQPCAAIAVN